MNICPKCGLPLEACVCKEIAKTQQEIEVRTEKRIFGKVITLVKGLQDVDIKDIAKQLKSKLACGGTVKNKVIELQGEHRKKVKPLLVEMGFEESQIKD
ncbi:MAG: stress response translation initiation inhibitor YciH [Candidatus Nanoarchaeia archaeon]